MNDNTADTITSVTIIVALCTIVIFGISRINNNTIAIPQTTNKDSIIAVQDSILTEVNTILIEGMFIYADIDSCSDTYMEQLSDKRCAKDRETLIKLNNLRIKL